MSNSSLSSFPTRSEQALVRSIIRDEFGETAEKTAHAMLRADGLRLEEIVQHVHAASPMLKPSVHEIKSVLLKLLQHNVLDVKPVPVMAKAGGAASVCATYKINVQEVLYRLRFPKFVEQAKEGFGLEGEVIMEEILVRGRVRMDQSLENMAYSLAEHKRQMAITAAEGGVTSAGAHEEISEDKLEQCRQQIRSVFVEMAKKRYISRVHPLDMTVPQPEARPDLPLSITRGQHDSSSSNSNNKPRSGTGTTNGKTQTNGSAAGSLTTAVNDDGITVRDKKKKKTESTGSNIPVELQMMLEADDSRRKEADSEAEYEPETSTTSKKRKFVKKAKLPTRVGASTTTSTEYSNDDAAEGTMGEEMLVWRFGVDQLMRDLRHQACIKFATENINNVAGVIVTAMLKHSSPHEREKDEATSFPVTARDLYSTPEVKAALPKESKDTWRLLLNYITVMCRDKSGMVMKVAAEAFDPTQARAGDGGQYVVHMAKIVEFLRQATTHSYIQEKYGTQSARIVRLLMEKRQLEQQTIGELALLPSNDARRRLYELLKENFVKMQEIPKRADHNPAFTIFCWSIDVPRTEKALMEHIQDSLCKLRRRRKAEAEENKELIARSDQLVESNDLTKFDKLSRALDRLDRAIIHLDSMLMLYRDF